MASGGAIPKIIPHRGSGRGKAHKKSDESQPGSASDGLAFQHIVDREANNFRAQTVDGVILNNVWTTPGDERTFMFQFTKYNLHLDVVVSKNYPDERPRLIFVHDIPKIPGVDEKTGTVYRLQFFGSDWKPGMSIIRDMVVAVRKMLEEENVPIYSPPPPPVMIKPEEMKFPLTVQEFLHFVKEPAASLITRWRDELLCSLRFRGMSKKDNPRDPHIALRGCESNKRKLAAKLDEYLVSKGFRRRVTYYPPDSVDSEEVTWTTASKRQFAEELSAASASKFSLAVSQTRVAPTASKHVNDFMRQAEQEKSRQSGPTATLEDCVAADAFAKRDDDDVLSVFAMPRRSPVGSVALDIDLINLDDFDSDIEEEYGTAAATTTSPSVTRVDSDGWLSVTGESSLRSSIRQSRATLDDAEFDFANFDWTGSETDDSADDVLVTTREIRWCELPDHLETIHSTSIAEEQVSYILQNLQNAAIHFSQVYSNIWSTIVNRLDHFDARLSRLERKLPTFISSMINAKRGLGGKNSDVREMESVSEKFECPLCMKRGKRRILNCGDSYCDGCVKRISGMGRCPICRRLVNFIRNLY